MGNIMINIRGVDYTYSDRGVGNEKVNAYTLKSELELYKIQSCMFHKIKKLREICQCKACRISNNGQ